MKSLIGRGLAVYLAIAFGLSWTAQVAVALAARADPRGLAAPGGGLLLVAVALMWPPALGAYVARRWVEGGNFADAGLRWGPPRYLALAWFGPAALTVLVIAASLPIYPLDLSFSFLGEMAEQAGQVLPADPRTVVLLQVLLALTLAVPFNSLFAFGEEFGWRSYLLPRLMSLLGPWPGMLAHGAIWGFWHAPLIFLLGYNYPGHPVLGVPLFVVSGVVLGVLAGWLRLASRSVVPPTIAHGAFNAIAGLPLVVQRQVDPAVAGVAYSPVGWLVGLAVIGLLVRTGALRRAFSNWRAEEAAGPQPKHPHQ